MLLAMNYSKLCLGCCQCCFEHCCPKSSAGDVNPLLHYPYQDDRLLPPSIEHRSYAFPQLKRQFSFHPQIEKQFESEGRQIVARQPSHSRHTSIFGSSSTQHVSKDVLPSQQTSAEDISSEEEYSSGHSSLETNDSLEIQSSDSEPRSQRGLLKKMQSIDVETDDSLLQISLYYHAHQCSLIVHLYKAFNVPTKSPPHASNCFVVLYLLPKKKQICTSSIVPATLHPDFDQVLKFSKLAPGEVRQQSLVFCFYNNIKNNFVGEALLSLKSSNLHGDSIKLRITEVQLEKQPKNDYRGELLLTLTYWPDMGMIEGVILEATNLRKADVFGLADPYVKVYLLHRGKRREKWKTSTKKGTLAPVFNELFQFDVSNMQINDVTLQLVLMDFDRFVRNDRMGTIQIGDNSRQMSGQTHWRQMCLSPRQTISHWHSFLPVGRHLESYDSMDYPQ